MKYVILPRVTLLHGRFSRFLNCTKVTKPRKAPHIMMKIGSNCFMIISIRSLVPVSATYCLNQKYLSPNALSENTMGRFFFESVLQVWLNSSLIRVWTQFQLELDLGRSRSEINFIKGFLLNSSLKKCTSLSWLWTI